MGWEVGCALCVVAWVELRDLYMWKSGEGRNGMNRDMI